MRKKNFFISTPVFNGEKYIKDTLETIHNQNYRNYTHLVFDGLSKDNTVKICEEYPEAKIISKKDNGQTDAINQSFEYVPEDANILAWQNADDLYDQGCFEKVAQFFKENPEIGLVYGNYHLIDAEGKWLADVYAQNWNFNKFKRGRFCPVQPTVFWRKDVWDKVKPLDVELYYCMDVDFYSRIVSAGFQVAKIDAFLGSFRVHDESKTQNSANRIAHKKEYKKVLDRHFDYKGIDHILFEWYYKRARLTSYLKKTVFKKTRLNSSK